MNAFQEREQESFWITERCQSYLIYPVEVSEQRKEWALLKVKK